MAPSSEALNAQGKPKHSLGRSLLLWFLLLSLLPLTLTSWFSYRQSVNSLTEVAIFELRRDVRDSAHFLQNWFSYRVMDLNSQAENQRNAEFLSALKQAYQSSGKTPTEFVVGDDWASLVKARQSDLVNYAHRYDYIYDLLLIDDSGNILYSTARESDLGSNLFDGPLAQTRFSTTVKSTLSDGALLFSDLEYYAPINNQLAGFLTAPILDERGEKIGVFAIHLQLERINALMLDHASEFAFVHYLVGSDGLLRTPLAADRTEGVLTQRINTPQFQLWLGEHGEMGSGFDDEHEIAFDYIGPDGNRVIGLHQAITLPGVSWALISEVDQNTALSAAKQLGSVILGMFFLTALIVTWLASYQTRRITRPIILLSNASMAVASGKTEQQVAVDSDDEIGLLAKSFNHMLKARQAYEKEIESSHQKAQQALADLAEQKFALDQHSIVVATNLQGSIVFVNDKFSEISGYSRDELLGQNHRLLKSGHHDLEFFKQMYRTITSGHVWHGELCNRAKDGHLYWVDTTIVPFMDEDGKPKSYIAIRTDITKQKQVELALLEAKEVAESATEQKSEFLANMSHEIRTPMNGIIGMTGLLLDTPLSPKQRSFADTTMRSADALLTIINDILDFSKIEAGKLELEMLSFDLQALIEDIGELMALKCREKGIEMLLHYKLGTERSVFGDPGRVRQVLLNLLSNAIKFTAQGHVLVTVESTPLSSGFSRFRIKVEDTGTGIAEDNLDHIFNKFDQEDATTTRKYGGTGLGLAISKQLSAMMGGDITVTSKKGEGSAFSFTMKLGIDSEGGLDAPLDLISFDKLNGLKILIIDDNALACTILSEQLAVLKAEINTVTSGREGIDHLKKAQNEGTPYHIVITDYCMPEMDGKAVAGEISKQQLLKGGILLFVTSLPQKGDGTQLKALGIDGYLTKPTHPSEVAQMLSLIWSVKQQKKAQPLVTRHMLQTSKRAERSRPHFHDAQILLAEDNSVNVAVATELLERYGCSVTPAGNGCEAVAMVKEREFDLIFMDCQMPEMDGFEATKNIRSGELANKLTPIPIVAFTANAMKSDQDNCLNAGMDDFITKPVNQEALEEVLVKWLSHKLKIVEGEAANSDTEPQVAFNLKATEALLDLEVFGKLSQLFGDKFPEIVEQHTQNAQQNITRIEEAILQNDLEALERAAHSIKGASAQFGATQLTQIAKEIEALAKEGDIERAKKTFAALRTAQQQVAEVMVRYQ